MAKKEFQFRGKSLDELKAMGLGEFAKLVGADARRKLKRGFTDAEKALIRKIRLGKDNIETHCRDMIVLPEMVGKTYQVYNGKQFKSVYVDAAMIGHRLGEFSLTRSDVKHNAPGIGATRSSASLSVK